MRRSFFLSTIKILCLSFFVILITIFISSHKSYADTSKWPSDPTVNLPIVVKERNQDLIATIEDGSGGAYIFWWDELNGNSLYAQRFDSSGNKLWAEDGIPVNEKVDPGITLIENGGVILVWSVLGEDKIPHVYAKYIDPNGTVMWDSGDGKGLLISGQQWGFDPVITNDDHGGAVIAWTGSPGSGTSILVQRIDQNGRFLWNQEGIPLTTYGYQKRFPKIVRTSEEKIVVVWKQHASFLNSDIYAQMVDLDGNLLWQQPEGNPIVTDPLGQNEPKIVSDSSGGVIIGWLDGRDAAYIQRADKDGRHLWALNGVNVAPTLNYGLFSDGEDGAFIVWQDFSAELSGLHFQRVGADGNTLWDSVRIPNISTPGIGTVFNLKLDPDKNPFFIWEKRYDPAIPYDDIYAQRIDRDGNFLWELEGKPVSNAEGIQRVPQIIPSSEDSFIVTWVDERNGNYDIYAQKINLDGTLGPEPTPSPTATSTNTPTPTPVPGWELPVAYEGRGEFVTAEQFIKGFWTKTTAYFDHYREKNAFASFLGTKFLELIGLYDCEPKTHCYDTHQGLDIVGNNLNVYSVDDGTVLYASEHDNEKGDCTKEEASYGCIILIRYTPEKGDGDVIGLYAHLQHIYVEIDQQVNADTVIGLMGQTGKVTGVHLHLGIMQVANALQKQDKKAVIESMTKNDWKGLIQSLPPIDHPFTDEQEKKHFEYIPEIFRGGQHEKSYIRCTYTAPNGGTFTYVDPFSWKGIDTDPWSLPEKKNALKDNNKDGEKEKDYGCGVISPYLWKYDVGTGSG